MGGSGAGLGQHWLSLVESPPDLFPVSPLQGLPGVPGKRGKMGRPVKIFRVYYADSMGESDVPGATHPQPRAPAAWVFSASVRWAVALL